MFEGPGPSSTRADGCNSGNEELAKGGLPFERRRLERARKARPCAGGDFYQPSLLTGTGVSESAFCVSENARRAPDPIRRDRDRVTGRGKLRRRLAIRRRTARARRGSGENRRPRRNRLALER